MVPEQTTSPKNKNFYINSMGSSELLDESRNRQFMSYEAIQEQSQSKTIVNDSSQARQHMTDLD